MHDVAFYTHAIPETGFGHVARCVNIVKLLRNYNKELDIVFIGEFSQNAIEWINSQVNINYVEPSHSNVAIYDRMDDAEFPERFSASNIRVIKNKCNKLIFFANSPIKPKLPEDIIIIGQYLDVKQSNNINSFFGLKFAPTLNSKNSNTKKLKNNIFVALGGAKGFNNINKCMEAISHINYFKTIDVLESPLNPLKDNIISLRPDQKITYHSNIPNIEDSLSKAGLVLASYGHLGYQALAQGAALCLIGQKKCQAEYANTLSKSSLCISVGLINEVSIENIVIALEETIKKADILSKNAQEKLDGKGLQRITDIVYRYIY
jgi:spore coat polysaccharide biosynthesis predicted glycosyltransferase SpsG